MGVLTDFIVASEEQARGGLENIPIDGVDRIDMKGIEHVAMTSLDCILRNREWDAAMVGEFRLVYEGPTGGVLVFLVPPVLVERLAALDDNAIDKFAELWSRIEEFQPGRWGKGRTQEDVHETLDDLAYLARRAQESGKQLYMWMSL